MSKLRWKIKQFYYFFKRHFWNQWRSNRFLKPLHFLRIYLKHKFLNQPYLAIIETGNICNLTCPTCPTPRNKIKRKSEQMSFENFKKVIDKIKKDIHTILLYNTNEPLLNPEIEKMIAYADYCNLHTVISTNATILNEKRTESLLKSGLDEILLCLDGTTKESYEPFRRGASFESVLANISYFCSRKKQLKLVKPFTELQFIVNKLNQGQVEDVKKIARQIRADKLHIKSLALNEYAYTKEEIKILAEKFFPNNVKIKTRYIKIKDKNLILKNQKDQCSVPDNQITVLVDGRMVICCYDLNGDYTLGNIFNQSLNVILTQEKSKQLKKMAKDKKLPLCKTCVSD